MTDPLLPEPTWRPAARARSVNGGTRRELVVHAVRGCHTLCGLTAWRVPWVDDVDVTRRCAECATVPDGHAVHNDLTALGLTYRQVDWWCRKGWINADNPDPGSGVRRAFPPGEVQIAAVMAALTKAGVSASAAHRAARNGGLLAPGVRVELAAAS